MKKLFLLTFTVALLCTWAVAGATNSDVSIKDRLNVSGKAAATMQQPSQEKAVAEKEMEQPRDASLSSLESEFVTEKAPYNGPKNVPDQNIILQGGDDCATATAIGALPYSDNGTTAGYANNYDEACPYTGSTSPDVVYSYSPAADILIDISLCTGTTDYDTKVYVYANDCIPGTAIACNDDLCTAPLYGLPYNSLLECVPLTAGNTYYIVVDGYGGDFGPYTLVVEECAPPTGACCVAEECVATNTEAECAALGGLWFEGQSCPGFQCPIAGCIAQAPNQVNGLFADYDWPQFIAENFILAAATDVYGFEFWGGYYSSDTPMNVDDFTIYIRADAGGAPGAALYEFHNIPATFREQTGVVLFGVHEWRYEVCLGQLNFGPGVFWVEINNATFGNPDVWFWETGNLDPSNGSAGFSWNPTSDAGPWNFDPTYDMSLTLLCSPCVPPSGACCNEDTGDCTDNVSYPDCPTGYRFEANTLCADLDPACGEVPPCADETITAPGSWSGNTCGAGNDCALRASEEYIYEVVIPNDGTWAFETCGSSYDTYIFIGTSCCGQEIGFNDDSGANGPCPFTLQSYLEVNISAGTYYVSMEGFSGCGSYVLNIYQPGLQPGACCVAGECVGTMTEEECAGLEGIWYGGETCPEFQCPIPGCVLQPPNANNGYFADYDWPQWMADNFIIGQPTTMYGFSFYGGYFSSDTPMDVDDFTVYIRDDAGGLPGGALYEFHNVPATFREQTGEILFGVHEWYYEICLGQIDLPVGVYWAEINNNTVGNPDVWFWETGDLDPINGIVDCAWTPTSDAGPWNVNPGELAFALLCEPCVPPTGACCDDNTSTCMDDTPYEDCPPGWRFVPNTLCSQLDPPCEPVLGACCVGTDCVGDLTEDDCAGVGGTWYEGQSCANFDCAANALCIDRTNVVYNNGDTDGANGLSMLGDPYRSVLDDITVEEQLTFEDFHQTILWTSGGGPFGTGYELTLWDDAGGAPGAPIYTFDAILVSEAATGRVWFSRPEFMLSVRFTAVTLDPGTYWFEMRVLGPENAFVMAMANDGIGDEIIGQPCWVNYTDFGGLQPGINIFGVDYGINFCLTAGGGGEFPCGHYVLGDYNGSEVFNIADVIAAFSKLQTGSPNAANMCECPPGGGVIWPIAFDVNNNCVFNLADVIVAFSKLQTGSPELDGCDACPPAPSPSPGGGDRPLIVPNLESKATIHNQSGAE